MYTTDSASNYPNGFSVPPRTVLSWMNFTGIENSPPPTAPADLADWSRERNGTSEWAPPGRVAKIIGRLKVEKNAKIGANVVVLTAVLPGVTAVGLPARIV